MGSRFTPVPMQRAQHQRPLARQLGHLLSSMAGPGVTEMTERLDTHWSTRVHATSEHNSSLSSVMCLK